MENKFFKKVIIWLSLSFFPTMALAAGSLHIPGYNSQNSKLAEFMSAFYKLALATAGVAAVVVLIIAGIYYITAGGDTNKESRAKELISNAVTGLLIIILAYVILLTINPKLAKVELPELPSFSATSTAGGGVGAYAEGQDTATPASNSNQTPDDYDDIDF